MNFLHSPLYRPTKNPPMAFFLATLAASLVTISAGGCHSGRDEAESKMTSYSATEAKSDTANLFTVPPDQMAHLQVVTAEKTSTPRVLRLTGTVAYNAFKTTPVFSAIGGPVQEILAEPGQYVRAGQALLTVASPDFSASRSTFIKARDAYRLADQNYQRSLDLYQHHAIAQRDLQQAESIRAQAQADVQSSQDALRALGIRHPDALLNSSRTSSRIPLTAPSSGQIVERLVGPGQLLMPGTTQCFTISDISTVWVLVNVYQRDLAAVHTGDPVEITTDAYPDTFHGKISYLAAALDPATRTLQARIVTENRGAKLKKDMYVNATVQAGTVNDVLTVPDAAVLRDTENQPFVYIQSGSSQFARRQVKAGESHDGRTVIEGGLNPGDRIVGDGGLFLQFKNSMQH